MDILGVCVHFQRLVVNLKVNRNKIGCELSPLYLIFIDVTRIKNLLR